jgi:hypothetical protein
LHGWERRTYEQEIGRRHRPALSVGAIAVIAFALGARSSDGRATGGDTIALEDAAPPEVVRVDAGEIADGGPDLVRSDADGRDGSNEGVRVHGHWIIEVTEPDGRFVSRNEFDNDLVTQFGVGGRTTLVKILARENSAGFWRVDLTGPDGAKPCNVTAVSNVTVECRITELPASHNFVTNGYYTFSGLTAERSDPLGSNPDELVLTGSVAVQNSTDITEVNTKLQLCPADQAPEDLFCTGPQNRFTEKTLDSAVPVLANQVVNVTVILSFS